MKAKVAGILANAALLLASCLAGLLLCEAGLRLFHPKYADLAEAPFIQDSNLIWQRIPHHRGFKRHPVPGVRPIPFFHNNLGLRQHRDFSAEDIENSVNIGFFGDSFLENIRMRAQFSFTEPLDYLLNIGEGSINVLNFGVAGYGTAHSLLRYELLDFREALDHVFYVYCSNDLMDNLAGGLFHLDDAGRLARGEALPRFTLLSKLHLSYLVLDAAGRLSANTAPPRRAFSLFQQILRRWKEAAESNGASFRLVWLPLENHDVAGLAAVAEEVAAIAEQEGVETHSLQDCFGERDPAHLHRPWELSPYRIWGNNHWNEAGNRLAAVCLHRVLEGDLGLPRLSEEEVALALRRYYSAFGAPASASAISGDAGQGAWGDAPRMKTEGWPASPQAEAIRRKYAALAPEEAPSPAEQASRAGFDVQLRDGHLAYIKEDCTWTDFQDVFFLHVYPADAQDLPVHRREHGFDNLDFMPSFQDATCTIERRLPGYAIDRIRTGQFFVDAEGGYNSIWEAEFEAIEKD